jgi:hypothetical protein
MIRRIADSLERCGLLWFRYPSNHGISNFVSRFARQFMQDRGRASAARVATDE